MPPKNPESSTSINKFEADADQFLPSIPAYIRVPNGYDYYVADKTAKETLEKQQVSQEQVDAYLNLTSKDILIIPNDQALRAPDFEISVRVKTGKQLYLDIGNLAQYSENEINEFAKSFVKSFGTNEFKIHKTQDAVFIIFNWQVTGEEVRCATIVNSKMVYIIALRTNGEITEKDMEDLTTILDSFTLQS